MRVNRERQFDRRMSVTSSLAKVESWSPFRYEEEPTVPAWITVALRRLRTMRSSAQQNGDDQRKEIRERLRELNTKSYYLLVALSFLLVLGRDPKSGNWLHSPFPIQLALTSTALAAVAPLQDFFSTVKWWLGAARWFKVVALCFALACTLYWVWTSI